MTLVLDASALCELLVGGGPDRATVALVEEHSGDLNLPHLAVVETASALRRMAALGVVPESRAREALDDLAALPAARWPADELLPRIWSLRRNLSAYDATYVALAESLDGTLLTGDQRLAHAPAGRARCDVRLVGLAGAG